MFFLVAKARRMVATSLLFVFIWLSHSVSALASSQLEQQRALYDKAQQWLDNKEPERYLKIKSQLETYPLTPYLDYRTFLIDLNTRSPQEVNAFIEEYRKFPFSVRIREPYLQALGRAKQWDKLLSFKSKEPKGEVNQCYFYTALWYNGYQNKAIKGGVSLWLKGRSVADQCDDLFAELDNHGVFTDALLLQRMGLAFNDGNRSLMRYLSKKIIHRSNQHHAQIMMRLFSHPELVTEYLEKLEKSEVQMQTTKDAELVELGLTRLSRIKPLEVQAILSQLKHSLLPKSIHPFLKKISEKIAIRLLDNDQKNIERWRDKVLKKSVLDTSIQQRIRLAIERNDWRGIHRWILLLDSELQEKPEWQYWLGRSEVELGKKQYGTDRLVKLLGMRNFYSVAVANLLGRKVNYAVESFPYQPELLAPFSVALKRIGELLQRDKITAARSEWYWLLRRSSNDQAAMLAQYAMNKGWSHYSVVAAIQAKLWSNLTLRFPISYLPSFARFAQKYQLDPVTLMSLARQESALDETARSSVGARGLMQLMPQTAKYTAKKYKLEFRDSDELFQAEKNIEIGSYYFAELMKHYGQNRVLSLAAYNAGPSRVDRWLKERGGKLDVFQFIESIPFKETRRYVQNILMFETYYRRQLGIMQPFLKEIEINKKY
jgi:soluble lytic murein transglycosylase